MITQPQPGAVITLTIALAPTQTAHTSDTAGLSAVIANAVLTPLTSPAPLTPLSYHCVTLNGSIPIRCISDAS
jgi:hypothetical protein